MIVTFEWSASVIDSDIEKATKGQMSAEDAVKSMQGESLTTAELTAAGIPGDRVQGLLDPSTGKLVSAKDPRRWGHLLDLRATWQGGPTEIELPDGSRAERLAAPRRVGGGIRRRRRLRVDAL